MSPWIGITSIVFSAFCMQHSIMNTERVYWHFIELHELVTFAVLGIFFLSHNCREFLGHVRQQVIPSGFLS